MKEEGGNVSPQESQHFLMCFLCFRNLFIFYQEITSFPLKLQWSRLTSQHGEKSVCWFVSCLFCWHKTDPAGKHPDLNSCWEPSIFFFKNSLSPFFLFVQLASQKRAIITLCHWDQIFWVQPFFFLLKDRCNCFSFWIRDQNFSMFQEKVPWAHTTIFQEKGNCWNPSTFYNVALKHKLFIFKRK